MLFQLQAISVPFFPLFFSPFSGTHVSPAAFPNIKSVDLAISFSLRQVLTQICVTRALSSEEGENSSVAYTVKGTPVNSMDG